MIRHRFVLFLFLFMTFAKAMAGQGGMTIPSDSCLLALKVEKLEGFPTSEKGYEQGVSACYAGTIGDYLFMAGGCNFPEVPAALGGKKRYYRGIYKAHLKGGNHLVWKKVGELPVAAAYGVSVSVPDGIICIGGNNEKESLNAVFKIRMKGRKAIVEQLPALPEPLDNFTGALLGDSLVVFGSKKCYAISLSALQQGWRLVMQTDVIRQQPVSGFVNGDFCIWGGFSPKRSDVPASLSLDGLHVHHGEVHHISGPVHPYTRDPVFLGGAASVNIDSGTVVAMGGVNKDVFCEALNHPAPDYLTWSQEKYQFNGCVFIFNSQGWKAVGENNLLKRAGAALVYHRESLYLIGGELKPGIRTPSVCRVSWVSE